MANRTVRVLVADDDAAVREALVELIGDDPLFTVVAAAASADEAVTLTLERRPDLALLDVRMPGGGVSAAMRIGSSSPATRVVACSAFDDDESREAMLRAGALVYVVKGAGLGELLRTLRTVAGVEGGGSPLVD